MTGKLNQGFAYWFDCDVYIQITHLTQIITEIYKVQEKSSGVTKRKAHSEVGDTPTKSLYACGMDGILRKIDFGNEAGDDPDAEELTSYFVEQSTFKEFTDPRKRVLVATAKKGVGKSALIQWLEFRTTTTDPDAIVIKCRGADLSRSKFNLTSALATPSDHIRDWMVRLCAVANRELALRIKLAITDDAITMVEAAELDGYRSRNLVGCLLDRFQKILDKGQPTKLAVKDEVQLLKRKADRKLWILIDDLDATFQNTNEECLDLSTFFSACRYLAQDVKDVCFRVTMRTDVWPIVRRYDESLDKVEQYVKDIIWEQSDFRSLLYKRIKTQADILKIPLPVLPAYASDEERDEAGLRLAFVPKMAWGEKETYTYRVIYTLSYHRPRWAIQLCKLAQKVAQARGDDLMMKEHIDDVWGDFGRKRITDLVSEHKHQCASIEELVNSFRGCERRMTREALLKWVKNHVSNHMTPVIEGTTVKAAVGIAQFLYRIGFIVARSEESGRFDEWYEHYNFNAMPDFLTSRTNDDFGVLWEIHPCYRQALDITKVNRAERVKRGMTRIHRPRADRADSDGKNRNASLLPPIRTPDKPVTFYTPPLSAPLPDDAITIRKLAAKFGRKPHELTRFLVQEGIFVAANEALQVDVIAKLSSKFATNR